MRLRPWFLASVLVAIGCSGASARGNKAHDTLAGRAFRATNPKGCRPTIEFFDDGTLETNLLDLKRCRFWRVPSKLTRAGDVLKLDAEGEYCLLRPAGDDLRVMCSDHRFPEWDEAHATTFESYEPQASDDLVGAWRSPRYGTDADLKLIVGSDLRIVADGTKRGRIVRLDAHRLDIAWDDAETERCLYRLTTERFTLRCAAIVPRTLPPYLTIVFTRAT